MIQHSVRLLNSKEGLQKSMQVKESVLAEQGVSVSCQYVSQVMRKDMGARYTRIQKIPYLGNSVRCLLLR